jgi:hypothetical protein
MQFLLLLNKKDGNTEMLQKVMRKRTNKSKSTAVRNTKQYEENEQETGKQRRNSTEKEKRYRFPNFLALLRDSFLNIFVTLLLSAITFFLR